jgi:hypothetical protein
MAQPLIQTNNPTMMEMAMQTIEIRFFMAEDVIALAMAIARNTKQLWQAFAAPAVA